MRDERDLAATLPELEKPEVSLSFWMDGPELKKLARASVNWFHKLGGWAFWRVREQDPMTCNAYMLDLLAWERGVTRYENEPERLYRLRVNYAYQNGKDSGLISGWFRIFGRLELLENPEKDLELLERIQGQDWDIIGIGLNDENLHRLQDVVERIIIEEYGRTCRRYRLISRVHQGVSVGMSVFDWEQSTVMATQSVTLATGIYGGTALFAYDSTTVEV